MWFSYCNSARLKVSTRITLKIQLLIEREPLFNVIIRTASPTEKRLIIDEKVAREAYNDVIVDDIILLGRNYNVSDVIKKTTIIPEFITTIEKKTCALR